MKPMKTAKTAKTFARPTRRARINARAPIGFLPTCAALGLSWPNGDNTPTLAEAMPQVTTQPFKLNPRSIDFNQPFKMALCKLVEAETRREMEIDGEDEGSALDKQLVSDISKKWKRVINLADAFVAEQVKAALIQAAQQTHNGNGGREQQRERVSA